MLNGRQTDHSDKAVFAALAAGLLIWLMFDSFIFALIAGCVAFVILDQTKSPSDDKQEDH
jgi:hypothetical protein